MKLAFHEVSELEFLTYLEDIKNKLLKIAPYWHMTREIVPDNPLTAIHFLRQWDFISTHGRKQPEGYTLHQWPFAYDEKQEADTKVSKYFLLNQNPVVKT